MAMTLTADDINALKDIFATKDDIDEVVRLLNDVILLVDDRFDRLEARTTRVEKHLSRKRRFPQLKLS
jgi:hypothetical protein